MRLYVRRKRGFTLIEIMAVVGIIAILSAVVLVNVNEARKKARDDQRMSDLQQLQLAIRQYKDANGTYPPMGCSGTAGKWTGPGTASGGTLSWFVSCDDYISGLVPEYISVLPRDPISEDTQFGFLYQSDGSQYKILVYRSVERGIVPNTHKFARYPSSCTPTGSYPAEATYAVYSSGAACW